MPLTEKKGRTEGITLKLTNGLARAMSTINGVPWDDNQARATRLLIDFFSSSRFTLGCLIQLLHLPPSLLVFLRTGPFTSWRFTFESWCLFVHSGAATERGSFMEGEGLKTRVATTVSAVEERWEKRNFLL